MRRCPQGSDGGEDAGAGPGGESGSEAEEGEGRGPPAAFLTGAKGESFARAFARAMEEADRRLGVARTAEERGSRAASAVLAGSGAIRRRKEEEGEREARERAQRQARAEREAAMRQADESWQNLQVWSGCDGWSDGVDHVSWE